MERHMRGVVIVNTGSPSEPTPQAVGEYLREFLMDPRIVPMNESAWEFTLEHVILPKRSKKSAKLYESIWTEEGAPLLTIHERLARKLEAELGDGTRVESAMSYGKPSIAEAIDKLAAEGCDTVTVLPTYPQTAYSQASSVHDAVERAMPTVPDGVSIDFASDYHDHPGYIEAMSDLITDSGFGTRKGDRLLMLFHSIPIADIEAGDTYPQQVEESARLIAEDLALVDDEWSVGYQSRFDKGRKWLEPYAAQAVDDAVVPERLFVACPGFAAECLETLHSLDVELKAYFGRQHPGRDYVRVPCLNDSDAHARALAGFLRDHWGESSEESFE